MGKFFESVALRIQRPPLTKAESNPSAPIAMTNTSVFKSDNTQTIVFEVRTWSDDLVPTVTKVYVKKGEDDYDAVLAACIAKGLL